MGSFRLTAGTPHLHGEFNFTESMLETAGKSLRHSCRSELTRQGISLDWSHLFPGKSDFILKRLCSSDLRSREFRSRHPGQDEHLFPSEGAHRGTSESSRVSSFSRDAP